MDGPSEYPVWVTWVRVPPSPPMETTEILKELIDELGYQAIIYDLIPHWIGECYRTIDVISPSTWPRNNVIATIKVDGVFIHIFKRVLGGRGRIESSHQLSLYEPDSFCRIKEILAELND